MKWFQVKEKSANKLGLNICWYVYNILGEYPVKILAFFIVLITYIANADLRKYSKDYFSVLYEYTNNEKFKPSCLNSFKNILNYAFSLVDKMAVFGGKYNYERIAFEDNSDEKCFYGDIKNKNGVMFICNHVGNIEVLRSLFNSDKYPKVSTVSIFMSETHCKIFTDFVSKLSKIPDNLKIYSVEHFDIDDAVNLESDLKDGGIAFMAGDRISEFNPTQIYYAEMLNKRIQLPKGVFKLAKSISAAIYFVSAIADKNGYKIFLKRYEHELTSSGIMYDFVKFMQEITLKYPYQFYHFCDYFEDL